MCINSWFIIQIIFVINFKIFSAEVNVFVSGRLNRYFRLLTDILFQFYGYSFKNFLPFLINEK